MKYIDNRVEDLKIAYIGGGSQGWAWNLMADLANTEDLSGTVALYDIDLAAAEKNVIIGEKYNELPESRSHWNYVATETAKEALTGADFVVISILPGTFDEMESDVHAPEEYDIWQSVGDTTGPGGVVRALRTMPMMREIARNIREYAPQAWVINYTNPMALCIKALYDEFPQIKAFGCCHEVFGTQKLLCDVLKEMRGIEGVERSEIKANVVGVNHFTWFTKAQYRDLDLFPLYREFVERYAETGYQGEADINWLNSAFATNQRVKMDLFRRYGYIAAAGDRHLAEFCPKNWYLQNEACANSWGFGLTQVKFRRQMQKDRIERGERVFAGEEQLKLELSGEEGVTQIRAILGLCELTTNVSLPNVGQIPNLPLGAVVETNASFRAGSVTPIFAGALPNEIAPMVQRSAGAQLLVAEAARNYDFAPALLAVVNDPLVEISPSDTKVLFEKMINNTKEYLGMYWK